LDRNLSQCDLSATRHKPQVKLNVRSNGAVPGERPATNRLSHGTANFPHTHNVWIKCEALVRSRVQTSAYTSVMLIEDFSLFRQALRADSEIGFMLDHDGVFPHILSCILFPDGSNIPIIRAMEGKKDERLVCCLSNRAVCQTVWLW